MSAVLGRKENKLLHDAIQSNATGLLTTTSVPLDKIVPALRDTSLSIDASKSGSQPTDVRFGLVGKTRGTLLPDSGRAGAWLPRTSAREITVLPSPICSAIIPPRTNGGFESENRPSTGL